MLVSSPAMDFYVVINIGLCRMFLSGDVCGFQCRYGGQLRRPLSPHAPTLFSTFSTSPTFHALLAFCVALTILAKIV